MDKAKIAKLCNEIEDIACDISQQTMDDIVSAESRMIFDKAKEIAAEISNPPKSNEEHTAAYWMQKTMDAAHEANERLKDTVDFKDAIKEAEAIKQRMGICEQKKLTNGDRIRQMTDEELAYFMVIQAIMGAISVNGIQDKAAADKIAKEIIMEHKADEDISAALLWLKQEVEKDACD